MAQPPETSISSAFPFALHHVPILDSQMAYIDTGTPAGSLTPTTTVFLHGNPTSSFIWRNIIPHVSPRTRCVAPDLIGMGYSSKPAIDYRFTDHYRYLSSFLDAVVPAPTKLVLVCQDWGSALAFHWATNHQERLVGLAFMEFIRPFSSWDDVGTGDIAGTFKAFRTPEIGRKMIIEENIFVKHILPGGVVRGLTAVENEFYERPFLEEGSREPVWRWPNEIPIEGSPADVWEFAEKYHKWLLETEIPKLLFWAEPGAFLKEATAQWYLKNLKNVKGVFLGNGVHYLQEDHPERIGKEVAAFIDGLN